MGKEKEYNELIKKVKAMTTISQISAFFAEDFEKLEEKEKNEVLLTINDLVESGKIHIT